VRASDDEENNDHQTGRSEGTPPFRSKKFRDRKRQNQFLLRAKYILLTYSQVDEDVFHPIEIKHLIDGLGGRCRIGREFHQNGGVHYHAFCVKDKRFISRDPRKFDIAGFHPNIEPILATPDKAWEYAIKDGNVIIDDVPERPVGRSKAGKKANDVYSNLIDTSTSANDMLKGCFKEDTRRAIYGFNAARSAAEWLFPVTKYSEYTPPPGLVYEYDEYPQIANWKQRYFCEYTPPALDTNQLPEAPPAEGDSVYSGEGGDVGSSISAGTSCTSLDALFGEGGELPRYDRPAELPKLILRPNQHRPRCLCIIGDSKLGKTLVARSFGPHSYFHGNWNVEQYNPDALYNIFDDIKGQLDGFDFRSFMGAQSDITVTDKYHKKRTVKNGKPAVYLSNFDPLTTRRGRENRDWLVANCTFVHITKPICNIARKALEDEIIDDALECLQ